MRNMDSLCRPQITVDSVNSNAQSSAGDFFSRCNREYERKVISISRRIAADPARAKIILLSGPSASGKTTTSLKIQQELLKLGIGAITISMDDFFKNRDDIPTGSDGSRDFESVDALDLASLKTSLTNLIQLGHAKLPVFNFKLGARSDKVRELDLPDGMVAVVEGLHALDPKIFEELPQNACLKTYVSVSSEFVDEDGKPVLTSQDVRLLRRAVRDYHFRASSVTHTLSMWDSVCSGEDTYIRPFKKYADVTLNSVFDCEPCLFRDEATALFTSVESESAFFLRSKEILNALGKFTGMDTAVMPGSCLLREFFGSSDYFNKKHLSV